jgi:hypothetical protein
MSDINDVPKKSKLYELDTYKEIEWLLRIQSQELIQKKDRTRIISIINSPGSELKKFISKISEKISMDVIKLNHINILKGLNKKNLKISSEFLEKVKNFIDNIETESDKDLNAENIPEKSIIDEKEGHKIDYKPAFKLKLIMIDAEELFENEIMRILHDFIQEYIDFLDVHEPPFMDKFPILILIFNDITQIPREIVDKTDITFKIPYLTNIQRLEVLEDLIFGLDIHTVDISKLSRITEGWNTEDLKKLVYVATLKWRILNSIEQEKRVKKRTEDDLHKGENGKGDEKSEKPEELTEKPSNLESSKANQQRNIPIQNLSERNPVLANDSPTLTHEKYIKIKKISRIPFTIEIFEDIINNGILKPLNRSPSFNLIDYTGNIASNSAQNSQKYKMPKIESPSVSLNMNDPNIFNTDSDTKGKNQSISAIIQRGINITELNSFTSNQLYQFAAATNFEQLILVLEKLSQGKKLDEIDRMILSDFPFVLKDDPQKSIVKLTNARNRINRIKKISPDLD